MKFRSILAIAALAVFSFTACEETENLGEAKVSVSPAEVTFDATGEKSEVVALTATRDWHIENKPDWVVVNPSTGKASAGDQAVTISVDPNKKTDTNAGFDREDDIIFTIGLAKASLHVKQAGEAGEYKVEQITCAEFIQRADSLTEYRLVGKVTSSVNTTYCSFDMNDGTATVVVWTVNNKDEWKDKVKQGGTVTVRGKYTLYTDKNGNQKHEMIDAYIEDFVAGQEEDPTKVEQITCAEFIQKADPNTTYRLVGKVTSSVNATYCSFDMNDGTATVVVWTVNNKDEWKDKVKQGGTVTVRGKYLKYEKDGNVKHEMVDAYIEKFEEGQSGGPDEPELDPKGTGTLEDPFNADGAAAYIKANGDKESTDDVYVKGKISSVKNTFDAEHGTAIFNISEDGSATATQFTAYSVLYLGNRNWEDGDAQIKVGDEVILCGKVTCYNGTYETSSKKAYVYSINGKTSIEQSAAFGVEKTEITVGAAATSATINVTGNVKWTATSEKATVNPASGEGKGAITVSFDANTDTENAKTYTVVVSTTEEVATKSYTVTITQGKASAAGATAYTLDGDAIKAAHTEAWSYTSGEKKVTATDGSEWILFNTYASKNQVTVQMNKGKSAYVLTPALPDGMEIKKIAVVLNTNNSGTGNMGDRPMDVLSADGKTTILDNVTGQTLADGMDVAAGNTQVRIICDETGGGAIYITSITVTYGAK